jgi:hypothetical protein
MADVNVPASAGLPSRPEGWTSKEYASAAMEYMRDKMPGSKVPGKAWAQRIIANPSAYPFISLGTAHEALGVIEEEGVAP